ncbi:hypothetical protein I4U23_016337 [Adineta vaga]|nr:hypothetical protein I4U23_016337 [Adineta vaga]
MNYYFIIVLIFTNTNGLEEHLLEQENDIRGTRLTVNDHIAMFADNPSKRFIIINKPCSSAPLKETSDYDRITNNENKLSISYVHNIITGAKPNKNNSIFAFIAQTNNTNCYLIVMWISLGGFEIKETKQIEIKGNVIANQIVLGIDSESKHLYVVHLSGTLYFNVNSKMFQVYGMNFWERQYFMRGEALAVTNDQRLYLLAYRERKDKNQTGNKQYRCLYTVDHSNVSMPISLEVIEWPVNFPSTYLNTHRELSTLSIDLNEYSNVLIIGIPLIDSVLIFSIEDRLKSPILIKNHTSIEKGVSFGKSVSFLDNKTYIVLAYAMSTSWSKSQIHFYSLDDMNTNQKPLLIFPNNQQLLPLPNILPTTYRIANFLSCNSDNLVLYLDPLHILFLPSSSPGYFSNIIEQYEVSDLPVVVYQPEPCMPGTHKQTKSFGPCTLCPMNTKNNGSSGITCEKCSSTNQSKCFLGSINEIDINEITNSDQAYSYPVSPESTQFEDLLLQNIFTLPITTKECFFISPVFWACSIIIICFLLFLIVKYILSRFKHKNGQRILKNIFIHVDLIGEGQYWLGGIISISLFILVIFACKFSISFVNLYPYEEISILKHCDNSLINAKFSSSLQLLSLQKHEQEKPIFTLLDQQNLNLNIQFISTGFTCDKLTIEQIRDHAYSISPDFNCYKNNSIIYISTNLPEHIITMKFDLIGPYFIAGIRLCLSAPSSSTQNKKYIAKEMKFCQFLSVSNQTITTDPTINIKIIKIINRTASMSVDSDDDDAIYSGLWLPTLTSTTLTDESLYLKKGHSYRYLSTKTTLIIYIRESEFFMKNTQEPIARSYEIIFNTILFSMLCLDLLGILFILFKSIIHPLLNDKQSLTN